MTLKIYITGITIDSNIITINYKKEHYFEPNTKRGICLSHKYDNDNAFIEPFKSGNIKWFYNYGLDIMGNLDSKFEDIEFVPKIWGAGHILDSYSNNTKSKAIMSFNEPFQKNQANMTISQIKSRWDEVINMAKGMRLGLVSLTGGVNKYKSQINELKSAIPFDTIDFIELHHYSCNSNELNTTINEIYKQTKKPIWITEFACADYSNNNNPYKNPTAQLNYMKSVLPMLEANPYVEKYSWFTTEPAKAFIEEQANIELLEEVEINKKYILVKGIGEYYDNYIYPT